MTTPAQLAFIQSQVSTAVGTSSSLFCFITRRNNTEDGIILYHNVPEVETALVLERTYPSSLLRECISSYAAST